MPEKYKRDLKEQNNDMEKWQRDQEEARRREAAPNIQEQGAGQQ
jgi:hypothetical protein